jgi:hypothetical protein
VSYIARTASFSAAIIRGLVLLLAFFVCLVVALMGYIWFISRPIPYVMYSSGPTSEQNRLTQQAALVQFQQHGACEHIGKAIEWRGRPALAFNIHPDFEQDEVGCIRALVPGGFHVEKRGWLS